MLHQSGSPIVFNSILQILPTSQTSLLQVVACNHAICKVRFDEGRRAVSVLDILPCVYPLWILPHESHYRPLCVLSILS